MPKEETYSTPVFITKTLADCNILEKEKNNAPTGTISQLFRGREYQLFQRQKHETRYKIKLLGRWG
jgi:hypothetical protein